MTTRTDTKARDANMSHWQVDAAGIDILCDEVGIAIDQALIQLHHSTGFPGPFLLVSMLGMVAGKIALGVGAEEAKERCLKLSQELDALCDPDIAALAKLKPSGRA